MAAIWRNIEGHNIEGKIHCTVSKLDETWLKYSLAIYHYVKVQQLDDICETRRSIKSKQDCKIWLKSCFRGRWVK
jgi:hypothetical protein